MGSRPQRKPQRSTRPSLQPWVFQAQIFQAEKTTGKMGLPCVLSSQKGSRTKTKQLGARGEVQFQPSGAKQEYWQRKYSCGLLDAKAGGALRAMADIGSHWFDMAEHLTGLRVRSLCADLQIFHSTRKRPKQSIETFGGKLLTAEDVEDIPVHTEDFGAVLFRMGERTRGAMTASQMSAGRKNHLNME